MDTIQVGSKIFSGEKLARYRRIFNLFDINKDGVLDARELGAVGKTLGYQMPKQDVVAMLKRLDIDMNRQMSFDEFLFAVSGNLPQQSAIQKQLNFEPAITYERPRFYSRPEPYVPAHPSRHRDRPATPPSGPKPEFLDVRPELMVSSQPATAQIQIQLQTQPEHPQVPQTPPPQQQDPVDRVQDQVRQLEQVNDMSYHHPPPGIGGSYQQPNQPPQQPKATMQSHRNITLISNNMTTPQHQRQQTAQQRRDEPGLYFGPPTTQQQYQPPPQVVQHHRTSQHAQPVVSPVVGTQQPVYAGEISKHREALAAFQQFDVDGNGFISREEAHRVLHVILGFTASQTEGFLDSCDYNSDGKLSYTEFVEFYDKIKSRKAAIDDAFCRFDREGKGYVTVADARRILGGMLFSDREIDRLVDVHDSNRDGVLQYHEFMHFWTA